MRAIAAITAWILAAASAAPAARQSLGTFAWQLEPYCNTVRFTVTPDGAAFRLTGFDDQCGAGQTPAAGVVSPNADGTFTLVFYLVTPEGQASHTTATLAPGSYSGPWKDDGGLTGTLRFGPAGALAGTVRPVVEFQRRVTGVCTGSEFVQKVREDGSVECAAAQGGGGGDITGVTAGTGLTGGGMHGDVTLGIAPGGVGTVQIANGTIMAADVNPAEIQRRVTGTCANGLYFVAVDATGGAACSDGAAGAGSTALGVSALGANTANHNTAVGYFALSANTLGTRNTAVGSGTLGSNNGLSNTAVGADALGVSTGSYNTAIGVSAMASSITGTNNVAIGFGALSQATAGSSNIAIGRFAGINLTTGVANIAIGNPGRLDDAYTLRIGSSQSRAFIDGIWETTTDNDDAVAVVIDSEGQLGTISSSRRTKEDIQDMADASAGLFRLRPVTFRYLRAYANGSKPRDYGLIAEEVAGVYPDLVVRNQAGDIMTVQYHKLVPMLLNEVQRLRRDLDRRVGDLDTERALVADLAARVAALEAWPR
jgi:hypothetical protein